MNLVPKSSIVPPGGFHFVDRSSGVDVRFDGDSESSVVEQVLKWRVTNGLPPGNPLAEYRDWLCGTWPHFCVGSDAPIQPTPGGREHISKRVSTWMAGFIRNFRASDIVDQKEANRRAAICATCPANVVYNAAGCGSCLAAIEKLSFVYKANRQTPSDDRLRACDITSQHNGTAVWATNLPPDNNPRPANCWRTQ